MPKNPFAKYDQEEMLEQKYNTPRYAMNDMGSVYTHYDATLGKNVQTENKLKGGKAKNGTSIK